MAQFFNRGGSFLVRSKFSLSSVSSRLNSTVQFQSNLKRAVIVGLHEAEDNSDTSAFASDRGEFYCTNEKSLIEQISRSGPRLKEGQLRKVQGCDDELLLLVGLGKKDRTKDSSTEGHDLAREAVRTSISAGVRSLKDLGIEEVLIDGCGDDEAAAEGAHLGLWAYDFLKAKKDPLKKLSLKPLNETATNEWKCGENKAKGQNFARTLMETPANHLTPKIFAKEVKNELSALSVEVIPRDLNWIREEKMGAFLSVSQGSAEEPVFMEMSWNNASPDTEPIVLVGKGVTFDTGGISIKPSKDMDKMRADMGGAACVTGCLYSAAKLKLPINLKVLIPLCENMPSSRATKPGDVFTAKNGKTIQVDNTDAEGRLILADALTYADTLNPKLVIDVATLTGAMAVAIGGSASGVYSTSETYWNTMQKASYSTGDRVWRMPLWNYYTQLMKKSPTADLNNISPVPYGGSCTAAAFLKEFVSCPNWMHLDIAGVMHNSNDVKYLPPGMAGRPTRTLVEFLRMLST